MEKTTRSDLKAACKMLNRLAKAPNGIDEKELKNISENAFLLLWLKGYITFIGGENRWKLAPDSRELYEKTRR